MSYLPAIDVSQYQGNIDWAAVKASGVQIAIVKAGGADAGLYTDSHYNANYYGAKAAGLAVGIYYFAGPGSAINQADHFVALASPLEQDDVLVLDWEIQAADPVGFCRDFAQRVHDRSGVWIIIYFNGSTWNSHDWSPVTQYCGVWVAWYGQDPNGNLPVGNKSYIMHQYTSGGTVPGIAGRVDLDAVFMPLANFKKYGYQAPPPAPTPDPVPAPEPTPAPVPPPTPPPPTPKPTPAPPVDPTPPPAPQKPPVVQTSLLDVIQKLIANIVKWLSKWHSN